MMRSCVAAVVDYGAGNLHSIQRGLERQGLAVRLIDAPAALDDVDALVVPGDGAFAPAMARLRAQGFPDRIQSFVNSGRPYLHFGVPVPRQRLGDYDTDLTEEFYRAFAMNAGITLHLLLVHGRNAHHIIEASFKALALALDHAAARDPRIQGVPSTKGTLA